MPRGTVPTNRVALCGRRMAEVWPGRPWPPTDRYKPCVECQDVIDGT